VGTDKLFGEYATMFPNAMAKFVQAESDDYEAKSVTFKEIEKRSDLFLIGRSGRRVVLLETQGYPYEELYYDMVKKIMLFCTQYKYRGSIDATAVFLEEAHYRAAEAFEQQFGRSSLLRFSPKVFVFSRIKVEELSRLDDVHLTPLYPLCDITPDEIEQQAPSWAAQIKSAPDLTEPERKNLLGFLGGAISHRIKIKPNEVVNRLFGGFKMEDTPIVQEILLQRIQRIILKLIAARFGIVPEDIRQKVEAISNTDDLEQLVTTLQTIQTIDELKNLMN
jgi:hypothetical protein